MTRDRLPREVVDDRARVATAPARATNRTSSASSAVAAELLGLQRSVGNRVAVVRAGQIQAKLMVGAANDAAERQADEVAHQVMRQLGGSGSAADLDEVGPEGPSLQRAVQSMTSEPPIGFAGGEVSPELAGSIQAERGRGHALPEPVRRPFERAFGTDLGNVRVHHDERSSELNRAVSARAFTIGSDIFLGASQYRPESKSGQELLAHEVTHTIQQGR